MDFQNVYYLQQIKGYHLPRGRMYDPVHVKLNLKSLIKLYD